MPEIPAAMGRGFATLGAFIASAGVQPLGPPIALYHDWTGTTTAIDLGFPVSAADAAKAAGEVKAGTTPHGPALKAVHKGSYAGLAQAYASIEAQTTDAGVPHGARMWEVYLNGPDTTPEDQLLTEIYTEVSAADAARFPAD
ncbi:MAG: GyrI-like domain-containing protein [Devosia sp.]|nr:GyrI-like domain-containing protein [Devosia sp.]